MEDGHNRGRLLIISAPSGTGKSTVIRQVLKLRPSLRFSVSATTREKRAGEENGREYHFISRPEFEKMIVNGELFEYAEYVGNYYGTPRKPIEESLARGEDVILDIEVQGAEQVRKALPETVALFIVPPDIEELERRLRQRGTDAEEKLRARLEIARAELESVQKYDSVVVNDDVERAAREIVSIIDKK
jgi:guanylate kinase